MNSAEQQVANNLSKLVNLILGLRENQHLDFNKQQVTWSWGIYGGHEKAIQELNVASLTSDIMQTGENVYYRSQIPVWSEQLLINKGGILSQTWCRFTLNWRVKQPSVTMEIFSVQDIMPLDKKVYVADYLVQVYDNSRFEDLLQDVETLGLTKALIGRVQKYDRRMNRAKQKEALRMQIV